LVPRVIISISQRDMDLIRIAVVDGRRASGPFPSECRAEEKEAEK